MLTNDNQTILTIIFRRILTTMKVFNFVVDNFYQIILAVFIPIMWLDMFDIILIGAKYTVGIYVSIPFLVILWKIDDVGKKLIKLIDKR